jgi:hypothetical protein
LRIVPRPEFAFCQKEASVKLADLGSIQKKSSKSVCTSVGVVYPGPSSSSISSDMRTPGNTEEDSVDPKHVDEGDTQREYSYAQPKHRSGNKKLPVRT